MVNSHRHVHGRGTLSGHACQLPSGGWHWVSPRATHTPADPQGDVGKGWGGRREFGSKFWKVISDEHDIDLMGTYLGDKVFQVSSAHFNEATGGHHALRSSRSSCPEPWTALAGLFGQLCRPRQLRVRTDVHRE